MLARPVQAPVSPFPLSVFRSFPVPKQKTHKGVKKRFRLTATGKVKHRRAGTSHLQVRVSAKRKRNLRGTGVLAAVDTPKIVAALGKYSY